MAAPKGMLNILALVLAVPFLSYGAVGLLRWAGVDRLLSNYLSVRLTDDPVTALGYLVIGFGVYYLLKLAGEKF